MASEVDIANLALSRLADVANVSVISPPEAGTTAEIVARFLPIARDSLLQMHSWDFATKTARLALLAEEPVGWDYMYTVPVWMIKALSVTQEGTDTLCDYVVETNADNRLVVLTNASEAILRYVERVIDPDRFSPLFVDALSWMLAANIAGPIIRGELGQAAANQCLKNAQQLTNQAIAAVTLAWVTSISLPGWPGVARGFKYASSNAAIFHGWRHVSSHDGPLR